jgi:uncharacterized SAM-dependent methyltransferase
VAVGFTACCGRVRDSGSDADSRLFIWNGSELGACPVGDEAFRNHFAVLTNDFGLAMHLFDDARISADILATAEVESQHLTIKLQDNTLSVSIKRCDFGEAVTTHWAQISAALAERLVSYAAERGDAS